MTTPSTDGYRLTSGNRFAWGWLLLVILFEFMDSFPVVMASARPDKLGRISQAGVINGLQAKACFVALLLGLLAALILLRRPSSKWLWAGSVTSILASHAISLWAHVFFYGDFTAGVQSFLSSGFIQKTLLR